MNSNKLAKGPVIVVLSDVHLGALKSEFELLYNFLRRINDKTYEKDVKAIIILGDFFDICLEHYSRLKVEFSHIFDLLTELQKKNIPIIFSLGNHEIPVTGNIETKFKTHKEDFIKEFENIPPLTDKNIGHYIEVRKDGTNLNINLYNSIEFFDKNDKSIQSIPINITLDKEGDFKCLLTHGHQFERKVLLFFIGRFWRRLIKMKNPLIKRFVDVLWNEVLSGTKDLIRMTRKDINTIVKQVKVQIKKKRFIRKCIYKIRKWQRRKKQNKNTKYFKRIKKFIGKKGRYQKLTHIVFGHTHFMETKPITVKDKKFVIVNSGNWQKIYTPTYLEINLNNYEIDENQMELSKHLNLLRIFNELLEVLGADSKLELAKKHPKEQKNILESSHMDIFETAKDKELITQENFEKLKKYNQNRQDYLINPIDEINIEELQDNIDDLKDIYEQTLNKPFLSDYEQSESENSLSEE